MRLSLVLLALIAGCVGNVGERSCAGDDDCLQGGERGTCAVAAGGIRACVFASTKCVDGEWGVLSPGGLGGRCRVLDGGMVVAAGDASIDAPIDSSTGETVDAGPVDASVDAPFETIVDGGVDGSVDGNAPTEVLLSLSPTSANLGAAVTMSSGAEQRFDLQNVGNGASAALGVSVEGEAFVVTTDSCKGVSLGTRGTCSVTVAFRPRAAGKLTGALVIGDGNASARADLEGTGLTAGALSSTTASVDLGSTLQGTDGKDATITVRNTGETPIAAVASRLAQGTDFTIVTSTCSGALGILASCTVTVRFHPASPGSKLDSLIVEDGQGGSATTQLSGLGLAPGALSVDVTAIDLGSTVVGQTGTRADVTITNGGGVAVGAPAIALTDASNFAIVLDGCGGGLAPNASCMVGVAFTPTGAAGPKTGMLTIATTAGVSLQGVALAPGQLTLAAASPFGTVALGASSEAQSLQLVNAGDAPTGDLTIALSGADPASFVLDASACPTLLAGGAKCTLGVTFKPGAVGGRTASLTVAATPGGNVSAALAGTGSASVTVSKDGDGGGSVTSEPEGLSCGASCAASFTVSTVKLVATPDPTSTLSTWTGGGCSGSGDCTLTLDAAKTVKATFALKPPVLSITPANKDFGSVTLGQTSADVPFTVKNDGGMPSSVISAGTGDASYVVAGGTCIDNPLAPGATCTVLVGFHPTGTAGSKLDTLTVSATQGGNATASLSGSALTPGKLTLSPATHDFGSLARGAMSAASDFTVTNTGESPADMVGATLSDTTNFTISANSCPTTLPAQMTCTVSVKFTPQTVGAKDSVSLTASASPGGSASATVQGVGTAQITVTSGSGGKVTSADSAIDCGTTCTGTFSSTPVALTAMPDADHSFSSWSGDCTGSGACSVPLDAAQKNVTATFAALPTANLSLAITDAPDPVLHDGDLKLTLKVTNAGPDSATGVSLVDTLGANTSFLSVTTPQGTCPAPTGSTMTCSLGTIASGASVSVVLHVKPTAVGSVQSSATVSGGQRDPDPNDNADTETTAVSKSTDLQYTVTDTPDPVQGGATLTYNVTVKNLGPDSATGVVADQIYAGTFVNATPSQGSACTAASSHVTCPLGSLAKNATATVQIQTTAPTNVTGMSKTGSASGYEGDPVASNSSDMVTTTVNQGYTLTVTGVTGSTHVGNDPNDPNNPGVHIDCPGTCSASFPAGKVVTLVARGDNISKRFSSWTGCDSAGSARNACKVTMSAAKTVTVSFATFGTNNLVFVSSTTTAPNIGIAAFDSKCNSLATAAGINPGGNSYVAWLSLAGPNPNDSGGSTGALSRLQSATVFDRVDGKTFSSKRPVDVVYSDHVEVGDVNNPIEVDENDATVANASVWACTEGFYGQYKIQDGCCTNWSQQSLTTTVGNTSLKYRDWTENYANQYCSASRRFYCFMNTKNRSP